MKRGKFADTSLVLRRFLAGLLLVAAVPATAHAQEEEPPLEDVTLRGRVLRADGSPLANTAVRVDAVQDQGFAFAAFFGTLGMSALSCFAYPNELCPFPHTKRFEGTTDGAGAYSFTFPKAHRRGEETNTDYIFSVALPPRTGQRTGAIASYELELIDAVHNAPDVVMWDPAITVTRSERSFSLRYERRADSKNSMRLLVGEKATLPDPFLADGQVDARAVEDARVVVAASASKDIRKVRTIYHQRFSAATVQLQGTLVPLSRGVPCVATRSTGARAGSCGYTNGDLATAGVADPNPCLGGPFDNRVDVITGKPVPCQAPITEVLVDLGAAKEIGDLRARCACQLAVSTDRATWSDVATGELSSPVTARYVRATGGSLASTPEISVWPPWPSAPTPAEPSVEPSASDGPVAAPDQRPARDTGDDDNGIPLLLALLALVALVEVSRATLRRAATEPAWRTLLRRRRTP